MTTESETLLEFPCEFPIKAMGRAGLDLDKTVIAILQRHVAGFGADSIVVKPSREGRYISVTATIVATSRAQLDAIYEELTAHSDVLMAL